MTEKNVDIEEFAIKVERLCDFLLDQMKTKDGSTSQRIIEDIKNEAIKLQNEAKEDVSFDGLDRYMKGMPQ